MYNNIGLQTPRGSGTSGYVSANKAKPRQIKTKLDFLKELKQLRENVLEPSRKANKDILEHKQKREIYVKLAELRHQLENEKDENGACKHTAEDIAAKVKQTEADLLEKYNSGAFDQLEGKVLKDSHAMALVKEKEQERVKQLFKISEEYKYGSAFDFDGQKKAQQEREYLKALKKIEKHKREKEEEKKKKKERKEGKKKRKERSRSREDKKEKKQKDRSRSSSASSSSSD